LLYPPARADGSPQESQATTPSTIPVRRRRTGKQQPKVRHAPRSVDPTDLEDFDDILAELEVGALVQQLLVDGLVWNA